MKTQRNDLPTGRTLETKELKEGELMELLDMSNSHFLTESQLGINDQPNFKKQPLTSCFPIRKYESTNSNEPHELVDGFTCLNLAKFLHSSRIEP
jgi:hypothetical protein